MAARSAATVSIGYDSFAVNKEAAWMLATRNNQAGPKLDLDSYINTYRMLAAPSVAIPMSSTMDSGLSTQTVFGLQAGVAANKMLSSSEAVSEQSSGSSAGISPAAQAGIAIGAIAVIGAIIIGAVLLVRKPNKAQLVSSEDSVIEIRA